MSATPSSTTLTYFGLPARAFVTRACLRAAGANFTDTRLTFPEVRVKLLLCGSCQCSRRLHALRPADALAENAADWMVYL